MRILHLATFLQGGAGRVIVDLALAQARGGHDVTLVTSHTGALGYGNYEAYFDELSAGGVQFHKVDSMFSRDERANAQVVSFLSSQFRSGAEPHLIHAHAATPSAVALSFADVRSQRPVIVQTMHGWGVMKTQAQSARDVAVMNRVDRVVVPSRQSAATIESMGVDADRIEHIPYGVGPMQELLDDRDIDVHNAMRRARNRGCLVLACVGTIGERKNQALLVEALASLDAGVRIWCVFIGDGDAAVLQSMIAASSIEHRAVVSGYRRHARRLAASADLLVLPSRSEGQPLAILEAFCDGPLVLASDIPELVELIDDGKTGFCFKGDDANALAERLRHIAGLSISECAGIQERSRSAYRENFTSRAMNDAYMDLYERQLAHHRPLLSCGEFHVAEQRPAEI
jgi:L-malate glycosyltransferase